MKTPRNIYPLTRSGRTSYAVQFKLGRLRYWRLFSPLVYGSEHAALEVATAKRDRIQSALDHGADAAWLFYVYGGADRPRTTPQNFIWQ